MSSKGKTWKWARSPIENFLKHVDKNGPNGCWIWTGYQFDTGYGGFNVWKKSGTLAHRASWTLHFGPIPEGLNVCHACDNKICVNPTHLWIGTDQANVIDKMKKGRWKGGCPKGNIPWNKGRNLN